jgi:hypothetical protein
LFCKCPKRRIWYSTKFAGPIAILSEITGGKDRIKQPAAGRNFPAYPVCISRFMVAYPLFLKIRQIHAIFIPHYFHWNEPVVSPDWCTECQKNLSGIQDIGKTALLYLLRRTHALSPGIYPGIPGTGRK